MTDFSDMICPPPAPELTLMVTILAIIAKFAITVSFFVVFLQSAEIYPTVLRGSGQALGSTMAYAVGIGSPAIIYLVRTDTTEDLIGKEGCGCIEYQSDKLWYFSISGNFLGTIFQK